MVDRIAVIMQEQAATPGAALESTTNITGATRQMLKFSFGTGNSLPVEHAELNEMLPGLR
jgi:hypothetical protein